MIDGGEQTTPLQTALSFIACMHLHSWYLHLNSYHAQLNQAGLYATCCKNKIRHVTLKVPNVFSQMESKIIAQVFY